MNKFNIKYIVLLVGICVFWLGGLPLIISRALPVVCENLTYNSEYKIEVKNPHVWFSLTPIAIIKAEELKIQSKKTDDKIEIENPKIKLRILPLLSGRVHINKIYAENFVLNSNLEKQPELDKNFINKIQNTKFKLDSISIKNFNISIKEPNIEKPAVYNGHDVYYRKNGRFVKLNVVSKISLNNQTSKANISLYLPKNNNLKRSFFNINIENFDIEPLGEYLKNFLPQNLKNVRGVIDIVVDKNHLSGKLKNTAIIMNDDAKSMIFPEELLVLSDFNLTRKTIFLDNFSVKSKNIDSKINGTISNYLDKPLTELNLNIFINKSKVEDFISLLPPFKTEDIDVYKLKKYKFYGDVIGNLSIKGGVFEPFINGSVFINNGILTKPIPNTKGATVKLDFIGKYLNFDVFVPASITEKVWVKGGVELYNVKYSDMHIWSTKKVDLALAEEKVVPIHEILNFIIGPVPIMNIFGDGNIDITVKGNRKNPHVWGNLNLYNVTTNFKEIPSLVLENGNANLHFNDENAVFTLRNGYVNNKPFDIGGSCELSGKFDFDVKSDNQNIEYFYKAIKTSTMIDEIKNMIPEFDVVGGLVNLKIKVFGDIKDISYIKFNENFFAKGRIELLGNTFSKDGIKIKNTKGSIDFDGTNAKLDISSFIGDSALAAKAYVNNKTADLDLSIPKLNLRDIVDSDDKFQQDIANILIELNAKYKGNTDNIELDKLDFAAKIIGTLKNNKLKVSNGEVLLKKGKLAVKNITGKFVDTNSEFNIELTGSNIASKPIINGKIQLKDFELFLFNTFGDYAIIPQNIRDYISQIRFDKGKINLNTNIVNNSVHASTDIGGIELTYTPLELPIKVVNGSIYAYRNYLGLNKINLIADGMPILIDGGINNIFSKRDFDLYINSKPKQNFVDKYINNNRIYPIKIKGDIVYQLNLKGVKDDYNVSSEANMAKDSSIYYLGATVGDIENAIVLDLDMNVTKQNILKIKEFSYDKIIDSQNKRKTRLNMLKASGGLDLLKDDLNFHDLKIKTENPTDARIFNIIFRKPNIKQGQFTSDLKLNGKLSNPRVLGTFHIFETNIPFFDTTMKNITFIFKDKTIDVSSLGEVLGNDVKVKGTLRNKLTVPYYIENAEVTTKMLDLNNVINKIKMSQVDDATTLDSFVNFDLKNTVIKNLKLNAKNIRLRNLTAQNVEATTSINENKVFNINYFRFNIADGVLSGSYNYNLNTNDTGITLKAKNINANDISYALFDLQNQLYGDLTGDIKLSCKGSDFDSCMKTLSGNTTFNVKDGRMPKLGSLEYLLKAGNLIKGGVTGISINSIIDIITPLKTGNFSEIYGNMNIKDGIANDIEISTKGKDLSLFISGTYNFSTSNADMEVLGLLSKKISTMFGPIGNMSLNTLFNVIPGVDLSKDSDILTNINKIPGIELSSKAFRKFIADIKGNINGDNYVTSFKWIN